MANERVGAVAAGPLVGNIVNSWWFYRRNADLFPRLPDADRRTARSLLGLGSQFFLISVMSSLALNADNLVIAHTLGLTAVTEYSIPYRALTALGLLVTLINLPLWPANGEALAQGETQWVRRITHRMTFLSAAVVFIAGAVMVVALEPIFDLWIGPAYEPPSHLLVALLTLWWVCTASASPRFMVQNAVGLVRPQIIGWTMFFLLSIPLKFFGVQHFGLEGIVMASIASYLMTLWPTAIIGYRTAIKSSMTTA